MPRVDSHEPVVSTIRLIVFFLVLSTLKAVNYNCNTVISSGDDVDDGLIKYGDKVYICLHFLPQNVKVGFKVEVDTHVALTIRDMFKYFKGQDTDVMIQLSNSEHLSPQIVSSTAIH